MRQLHRLLLNPLSHHCPNTLPANVRAQLVDVIKSFGITSMMDTSCGSMAWMPQALEEIEAHSPGFMFAGSDVVCSLIERHRSNFTAKANWRFDCIDYGAWAEGRSAAVTAQLRVSCLQGLRILAGQGRGPRSIFRS